ncbi:MAG TPA: FecR family protein [Steroidobacteraceae bacterium]|nr:FecR family protein [Steroidobacteraceae bacterium]
MTTESASDIDLVAKLLRTAGRREEPPAEAYERTLAAATDAWERKVRARHQRRAAGWAAIAASVVAAVAAGLYVRDTGRDRGPIVARIDRVIGMAELRGARDAGRTATRGQASDLSEGAWLRTDDGRLSVVLAGGASLRMDAGTEISLESATRVRLVRGRVYLDNGTARGVQPIEVHTPAGTAWDAGTQFEVQYVDAAYRLRVREGRVHVRRGAEELESAAGEQVFIDASGTVTRGRIARDDVEWRWVEPLSRPPDLDGQPVSELLAWVARETGRTVRFEPPDIEERARRTILHGDIQSLTPLEALAAMLETTDLAHALLQDGTIVIRSRANR